MATRLFSLHAKIILVPQEDEPPILIVLQFSCMIISIAIPLGIILYWLFTMPR